MVEPPIYMLQTPAFPINEALDLLGQSGKIIGDINDGTPVAEAARRFYGQGLRMLLRTAHWSFARKETKLTLLGDATGNAQPPISAYVERPWAYAYEWPLDAIQGRWLPWSPTNIQPTTNTGVPLTTGQAPAICYPMVPGRFLVSSTDQYPVVVGQQPWSQQPDLQRTTGVGPNYRKVILTDSCEAHFVYTRLVTVIEEWDALFRQAFVKMLAMALLPTAVEDPKRADAKRVELIAELKIAIDDARVANGNEAGMPQTVDHQPVWITARNAGAWGGGYGYGATSYGGIGYGGGGLGYFGCGWESMSWCGGVF